MNVSNRVERYQMGLSWRRDRKSKGEKKKETLGKLIKSTWNENSEVHNRRLQLIILAGIILLLYLASRRAG